MHSRWFQDLVIVGFHIAFVVDLDQHIFVAIHYDPIDRCIDSSCHSSFVLHPLVLSEVKQSQDDDHSDLVRFVDDPLHALQGLWLQRSIGIDAGVVPWLVFRVPLGAPSLQIDCYRQ